MPKSAAPGPRRSKRRQRPVHTAVRILTGKRKHCGGGRRYTKAQGLFHVVHAAVTVGAGGISSARYREYRPKPPSRDRRHPDCEIGKRSTHMTRSEGYGLRNATRTVAVEIDAAAAQDARGWRRPISPNQINAMARARPGVATGPPKVPPPPIVRKVELLLMKLPSTTISADAGT